MMFCGLLAVAGFVLGSTCTDKVLQNHRQYTQSTVHGDSFSGISDAFLKQIRFEGENFRDLKVRMSNFFLNFKLTILDPFAYLDTKKQHSSSNSFL